ncbi:deubiquitinase MYSM1-like isoform X2 [Protopterus annectens]|uniref:deubiquitinase MYSM1-like isoform X2 n=1 Tax=Protopterus annectens TaxID=7888 RepID=UPI001CFBE40C|nr:deubiquitinase MYSM1-like isoform X2 [Protopterus annectens]
MQCEMDPVSQTQASETLARRGFSLVGWYHSHPAFDPNPSVRDIDTQAKYQTYFSRGGAQFVGMIISPYNQRNPSLYSQITCLLISEELSTDGSFRLPYKFKILQTPDEPQWTLVLKKAQWIVENYRQSQGVPMESIFHRESGLTCLQKMMECMRRTLENLTSNMLAEEFMTQIEHVFHTNYQAMEESGNLEDPPAPTSEECLTEQIRRENET